MDSWSDRSSKFNEIRARALSRAHQCQVSPACAALMDLMQRDLRIKSPQNSETVLLTALSKHNPTQFINYEGVYYLARILQDQITVDNLNMKSAILYGAMFAHWMLPMTINDDIITRSYQRILELVKANPPNEETIRDAMQKQLREVNDSSFKLSMSSEEAGKIIGKQQALDANLQEISSQWTSWVFRRGNIIPLCWWGHADIQNIIKQLNKPSKTYVSFTNLSLFMNFSLEIGSWAQLDDGTRLGVIEFISISSTDEFIAHSVAGILVSTFSFINPKTLNKHWLDIKLQQIKRLRWNNAISIFFQLLPDKVTVEVIKAFAERYVTSKLIPEQMYRYFQHVHFLIHYLDAMPLLKTIESAFECNISSAVAFAACTAQNGNIYIDKLIELLPETEFKSLIELICSVLHNGLVSLMIPPVPVRRYPDLAYIGDYIQFTRTHNIPYDMKPHYFAMKYKYELDKIADNIMLETAACENVAGKEPLDPLEDDRLDRYSEKAKALKLLCSHLVGYFADNPLRNTCCFVKKEPCKLSADVLEAARVWGVENPAWIEEHEVPGVDYEDAILLSRLTPPGNLSEQQ